MDTAFRIDAANVRVNGIQSDDQLVADIRTIPSLEQQSRDLGLTCGQTERFLQVTRLFFEEIAQLHLLRASRIPIVREIGIRATGTPSVFDNRPGFNRLVSTPAQTRGNGPGEKPCRIESDHHHGAQQHPHQKQRRAYDLISEAPIEHIEPAEHTRNDADALGDNHAAHDHLNGKPVAACALRD